MTGSISFLAFDLGATSGRTILGTLSGGSLTMKELTRFPNGPTEWNGHSYWNILGLYGHLVEGMKACAATGVKVASIGIDTWGVDFALLGSDGQLAGLPHTYRDRHTQGAADEFARNVMPRAEIYAKTGIEVMDINSLYQLYAMKRDGSPALVAAKRALFMPDALAYMLTGNTTTEYTIASTSQLLNPFTRQIDRTILEAAGLDASLFGDVVVMPGTVIGTLSDDIARETGLGKVPVVAVAGHDTAAAVAAIPAAGRNFAFLSSGTWSLMGVEADAPVITEETARENITNEGGVDGTICLLKNLTGMWILERCIKEWNDDGNNYSYAEIVSMASAAEPFRSFIDTDDARFANPESMTAAIAEYCTATGQPAPATDAQTMRCIFESLALKYRRVLDKFRRIAPRPIDTLHIIGGGSRNELLCGFTASATGLTVIAGPAEATAIGNIMIQAKAAGHVESLARMREMTARVVETKTYIPHNIPAWNAAYEKIASLME